jgi:hypothetical protein
VIKQETNQNVQNENDNDTNVKYETFIFDKNSSSQQYIIHNKYLFTLVLYVHMNFIVRQIKSTTFVVIYVIMNTLSTTSTTFMNSKPKMIVLQSYTILSQKKTLKITAKQFVFYLHHGV